jgi:hypothetical protein
MDAMDAMRDARRPHTAEILRRSEERRREREAAETIDLGPSWAELCKPLSGKVPPKSALMSNQGYTMTVEAAAGVAKQNNARIGQRQSRYNIVKGKYA